MSKRTVFTTITPLPHYITRETVTESLHDHAEMIGLNPLVIRHGQCKPPPNAAPDEFHCVWYELTDKISYLPGGLISGNVSYKACFHDLPRGLQTHVYAPAGLDIKEKWTVCGNMPGEPRETVELGLSNAPREGLYVREDVDMRCNIVMTGFVKRTLKRAHLVLVDRLVMKADLLKVKHEQILTPLPSPGWIPGPGSIPSLSGPGSLSGRGSLHSRTGSVVSRNSEYNPNLTLPPFSPNSLDFKPPEDQNQTYHNPAYQNMEYKNPKYAIPEARVIPAFELPANYADKTERVAELE
jgi:hypothetical protein